MIKKELLEKIYDVLWKLNRADKGLSEGKLGVTAKELDESRIMLRKLAEIIEYD
jgi:hypothetical protein